SVPSASSLGQGSRRPSRCPRMPPTSRRAVSTRPAPRSAVLRSSPSPDGGSVDDRLRLLPHELLHVVQAPAALAAPAGALPAAERRDARPRAGRRTGTPVDVDHARLDLIKEALLL